MLLLQKRTSGLSLKLFNEKNDAVIGKVLSPHGVVGMVKVFPYSDYPNRVSRLERVELLLGSERRKVNIENASEYGRFWLVKFEKVDSREEAKRIRDSLLLIPKEERTPLPDGSYYHDQLVGLKVYSVEGDYLGAITDLHSTGGHDMLTVSPGGGSKDHLIPLVKRFVKKIDLGAGTLTVDLPEGLLEL